MGKPEQPVVPDPTTCSSASRTRQKPRGTEWPGTRLCPRPACRVHTREQLHCEVRVLLLDAGDVERRGCAAVLAAEDPEDRYAQSSQRIARVVAKRASAGRCALRQLRDARVCGQILDDWRLSLRPLPAPGMRPVPDTPRTGSQETLTSRHTRLDRRSAGRSCMRSRRAHPSLLLGDVWDDGDSGDEILLQ